LTTIRTLTVVATIKNWFLEQLNVDNTFLHGDLSEEIYMTFPPDINTDSQNNSTRVCRLTKSLYGLKQASKPWNEKLISFLKTLGFKQSKADNSLFIKNIKTSITVLLVYVDDIILAGDDIKDIVDIKEALNATFRIKDLGQLKFFLSLEIARTHDGIHICQRKCALDILPNAGMLNAKPVPTPMIRKNEKLFEQGVDIHDATTFRKIIGRLLYLVNTRPDISFVVQFLSQFVQAPAKSHHQAIQRILRYLKNSKAQGIFYYKNSIIHLKAFSDSDWASYSITGGSNTGYCIYLKDSLISWRTKKQSTISRSLSEAEYKALTFTCFEIQWLTFLLEDLCVQPCSITNLYCDSQSARHIVVNNIFMNVLNTLTLIVMW